MSQTQHIEEIKTILRRVDFTDKQIASYILDLDARLQASLIDETLNDLNPQEREKFEKLVENGGSIPELTAFLKLDKQKLEVKISQKIEQYKDEVIKQFSPQLKP